MTGIFPDAVNGGKVIRDLTKTCYTPAGVVNTYCPPATFTTSCDVTALPSDCTGVITQAQVNALMAELLALAVAMTPAGTWNCASVTNLAAAFTSWAAGLDNADEITITGDGSTTDPFKIIPLGVVNAICTDADAAADMAGCMVSSDADNGIVLGSDDKLYGAGTATDTTIDGTGAAANPFRVNLAGLVTALCASVSGDALAACLISTDADNALTTGADGRLVAKRYAFFAAPTMTGSANAWVSVDTIPTVTAATLDDNALLVGTVPASNTATGVTIDTDGVVHSVRMADGTTLPAINEFVAGHTYLWRYVAATGVWATVGDLSVGFSGTAAATATDGNVLYGLGAPTAADGIVGDWFLDVSANQWYGPKAAGGWTATAITGSDYYNMGVLGGSATAYTAPLTRPYMAATGPRNGSIATFVVGVTNTGTNPTLAANGGAARGVRLGDGSNLLAGDLIANHTILARYDAGTSHWLALMDLTTGKVVGDHTVVSGGWVPLAGGNAGYAAGTTLATVTNIDQYDDLRIQVSLNGTPNGTTRQVWVDLSTDNGATWIHRATDITITPTMAGTSDALVELHGTGDAWGMIVREALVEGSQTTPATSALQTSSYGVALVGPFNAVRLYAQTALNATWNLYGL